MKHPLLALLLSLVSLAGAAAADLVVPLPSRDGLLVDVPKDWTSQVRAPRNYPPTIEISPRSGGDPLITITPIWFARGSTPPPTDQELKELIQDAVAVFAPHSVERDFPLIPLEAGIVSGYYVFATHRSPKLGEPKYIIHGVVGLRELRVAFNIVMNADYKASSDTALQIIKSMRRSP